MLPVWVDATPMDVYEYSPILADRVGVRWHEGLDLVVAKLADTLRQQTPG